VFVLISAEAGLSGDIDQRLIEVMLKNYDKATTDIIVLGTHGATMLKERGIPFVRYFQVPETDSYIDVTPVVEALKSYSKILVYYEEYVSLGTQDIKEIDLVSNIKDMTENAEVENIISTDETIFEPSIEVIADEMEHTMMRIALSQTIMESGLAQAASRFNAMAVAKRRAVELILAFKLEFHRAKRYQGDRRTREVRVGIKNRKKHMRAR
jgi:F0F1-type ATP synthase gamma subunit